MRRTDAPLVKAYLHKTIWRTNCGDSLSMFLETLDLFCLLADVYLEIFQQVVADIENYLIIYPDVNQVWHFTQTRLCSFSCWFRPVQSWYWCHIHNAGQSFLELKSPWLRKESKTFTDLHCLDFFLFGEYWQLRQQEIFPRRCVSKVALRPLFFSSFFLIPGANKVRVFLRQVATDHLQMLSEFNGQSPLEP